MPSEEPLKVLFYCDTDIVHTSYVIAGLKALQKEGKIALAYRIGTGKAKGRNGLLFSQYIKIPKQNRTLVFDMHDQSDYFFPDYIEDENVEYYKANFDIRNVEKLNRLVRPFVPYFPIKYRNIHWKQMLGYYLVVFGKNKTLGLSLLKNCIQSTFATLSRIRRLKQRGRIDEYFCNTNKQFGILFTPGCWPEKDEFQLKANQERYELIKNLRAAFPHLFRGGFPHNTVAIAKYSDALAEKKTRILIMF